MKSYRVDEFIELLPYLAERLRSRGFRVGVSETVELARLARSYAAIRGREVLEEDELRALAYAVLKHPGADKALLEELRISSASRRVEENAKRIEAEIGDAIRRLGAAPGWRVSKKKASRRGREALAAYLQLRRVGVITGRPGRERVADPGEIRRIAFMLARRGFGSLEEAYKGMGPGRGGDLALMEAEAGLYPEIASLDERRLFELGWAAARKGNSGLLRAVAREVARRIGSGAISGLWDAFRILKAAGMLDSRITSELIAGDPSLVEEARFLPPAEFAQTVVRAASMSGLERGGEILAKALKLSSEREAREILSRAPAEMLWAVKRHPLKGRDAEALEAAVAAARSLVNAIRFLETGNEGWKDMAISEAERALSIASRLGASGGGVVDLSKASSLARLALAVASLASEPGEAALDLVSARLGFPEAVRVVRAAYARAQSEEARRLLAASLERMLSRLAAREGMRLLPRWRLSEARGRIDVRRSVYRLIRYSSRPLVFRERARAVRVSLALDVSGSMIEYSSWAIAVATLFARNIERIVIFSHRVSVVEGPLTARELAEVLLSTEFKGYTNISAAIREASRGGSRRIVVVTDLKQTVDDEPVASVVQRAARAGRKVVFISPPSTPWEEIEAVTRAGGKVTVAYTPRQAAQRVLSLILR